MEATAPTSILLIHADLLSKELDALGEVLTDDEMVWEPAAGCWSVRAAPDGSLRRDWSAEPPIPPFTTIAWRLTHIGQSLAAHAHRLFGQGSFSFSTYVATADVRGTMDFVRSSFDLWRAGIAACGETMDQELALEVLSLNGHHSAHLAEIRTVRDLYRASQPLDAEPFIDTCLRGDAEGVSRQCLKDPELIPRLVADGHDVVALATSMARWHLVPKLLELGFPVEGGSVASPLHHAVAGFAPIDTLRVLVAHGADLNRVDPVYNATPLGWAEYFGNEPASRYLRSLEVP